MANVFIENPEVARTTARIRTCTEGKAFSDVVDRDGRQYVDFVMEGGGVLGISLLGYAYGLEQAGLRFLGLGGTSAGSIVALILAAVGTPAQAKAACAAEVLAAMPMASFIDGDGDARDLTRAMLEKAGLPKLLFKAAQCVDNVKEDLGLHPGKAFLKWLRRVLDERGVSTLAALGARMSAVPAGLRHRGGEAGFDPQSLCGRMVIVAADVTTETKVEFPRMAPMYWEDADQVHPALLARASMSIPFFFHPLRVEVPQGEAAMERWRTLASFDHPLPREAVFMDGGIMSNFPIDAFHRYGRVPRAPTFGAKIGFDRRSREVGKPAQLLSAIFDCARHTLDYDFIVKNPDYSRLVAYIDVEDVHDWLDFDMQLPEMVELFAAGVKTAADFLCGTEDGRRPGFDWEEYKALRATLAGARLRAGPGPADPTP